MRHVYKARVNVFICPIYNKAVVYENCTAVVLLQVDSELESGSLLGRYSHPVRARPVMGKLFKEGAKGKEKKTLGGPI